MSGVQKDEILRKQQDQIRVLINLLHHLNQKHKNLPITDLQKVTNSWLCAKCTNVFDVVETKCKNCKLTRGDVGTDIFYRPVQQQPIVVNVADASPTTLICRYCDYKIPNGVENCPGCDTKVSECAK